MREGGRGTRGGGEGGGGFRREDIFWKKGNMPLKKN